MVEVVGNWIVWACGIIISLWGVLGIIQKIIEITKKPEKDQHEKIAKIEQEIADLKKQDETFMGFFRNDKERIDSIINVKTTAPATIAPAPKDTPSIIFPLKEFKKPIIISPVFLLS